MSPGMTSGQKSGSLSPMKGYGANSSQSPKKNYTPVGMYGSQVGGIYSGGNLSPLILNDMGLEFIFRWLKWYALCTIRCISVF
jgi:hypothetical protein